MWIHFELCQGDCGEKLLARSQMVANHKIIQLQMVTQWVLHFLRHLFLTNNLTNDCVHTHTHTLHIFYGFLVMSEVLQIILILWTLRESWGNGNGTLERPWEVEQEILPRESSNKRQPSLQLNSGWGKSLRSNPFQGQNERTHHSQLSKANLLWPTCHGYLAVGQFATINSSLDNLPQDS